VDEARALVLREPGRLTEERFDLPRVGDDDGLLRVEACGLCGTDHEQFTGQLWGGFPFVPGHETVGVIEALGPLAAERWGVSVGDRVAVEVFQSCNDCPACIAGEYRFCARHGWADMYGFVDVGTAPALWGGYATHQYLAPDTRLLPVPQGLDPVVATLFNPLGAGVRWGDTLPRTRPGDVFAVLGPGVRGLAVTAAAKRAGAGFVLLTGRGARDEPRLELGRAFGADATVNVDERDPVAELRAATGGLADVVVDVTANAPAAFTQAIALARPGGTVVVAGTRGGVEAPGFHPDVVVLKELRVLGALGVDTPAYQRALDLLAAGDVPFATVPRVLASFDDLPALLTRMAGRADGPPPPVHAVFVPG
jgi:alcohol dehydrogenase